jgi:hypothetical protein
MQQATGSQQNTSPTRKRNVQVDVEVVPKGSCFVDEIDDEITDINLQFPGSDCQSDVTVASDDPEERSVDVVHHSGDRCQHCPGVVFGEYGLVPQFIAQAGSSLVVRTYLPADHRLSELIADLRNVSDDVRVLRVHDIRESDVGSKMSEFDLAQLTPKQTEALERAIERGYYRSPPEVSLSELADEFDISESALSQRIARGEEVLMDQLFTP